MNRAEHLVRRLLASLLTFAALAVPALATAQDDPPGRVGRIAETDGRVWIYDDAQGAWVDASTNRPLTRGDRVSTDGDARATLRVGSTTVRLGGSSELEVLRLDDQRVSLQLHSGAAALRVRSAEVAAETELVTAEARFSPRRAGYFRVDRVDDVSWATSWRGDLRVDPQGGDAFGVEDGRRVEVWIERDRRARTRWDTPPDDEFADWARREDRNDERSASYRYVSPEMTGAEDLDRYGSWDRHPEYGSVWVPSGVPSGWAPYRYGRWAWVAPWGWTWVDDAPWGFAPFHYGRWMYWGRRWVWYPGAYVARPVYAPALVAWVGGGNFSVGVNIGGPSVGWVPLAPREVFVPYYRVTPIYIDRVNHRPHGPRPVRTGPIMYGNQGVPGGVTVVSRDVLVHRQPVARAVVDVDVGRRPLKHAEPTVLPVVPRSDADRRQPPPSPRLATGNDDGRRGANWPTRRPEPRDERDTREPRDQRDQRDQRDTRDVRPPVRVETGRDGDRPQGPRFGDNARDDRPGTAVGRPVPVPAPSGRVEERRDERQGDRREERDVRPSKPVITVGPDHAMPRRGSAERDERPTTDKPPTDRRGGMWTTRPDEDRPARPVAPPQTVERRAPDQGVERPGREVTRLPVEPPARNAVQERAAPRQPDRDDKRGDDRRGGARQDER
ncbi:DUF6600 domain-containing protein [Rubrivivax gelatinosus]|uniref:FecR family protein n=1 Tax=Rubrivivax gelatinosus TaxID=28068 RepID=A0ABS1E197_RUBGE|nr:DUF6600 domain-containing protein [Rubrivivax gelatinosus]MBK1715354.1 hypothetical protein [Rubrivivax gelatinosus]